jgi:glycosyltransferase involved in cell wall biosynthesis
MEEQPTVSVIIPVFNQQTYLLRALSGIVPQLGIYDELVVVDDSSTDVDPDLFTVFKHKTLWLNQKPRKGVSAARNMGASKANGDWLKFLDADDVLAPFALSLLRQSAAKASEFVRLISGGCHRIHNGSYLDYLYRTPDTMLEIKENNPTLPSACMIRRDAFLELGGFDERIDFNEDWDLWLRLHERYGNDAFLFVHYPVCYYWIDVAERQAKQRTGKVDGLPIAQYLKIRYGVLI